ncbi:MAG TPA: ATP-binding protein [Pyrinomonadaceae bacterium]|nr:ATP-binding protein [Pyrinomonadaceae bacterium]
MLAEIVIGEKIELNLPSLLESVDQAASEAETFARQNGFDDAALSAIDMAVREAVANAVKHGNKLDETKQVEIAFSNLQKGLEITVRDFGKGFDVDEVPDPTNPENLLKANGRGILFMRAFMEEVEWHNHEKGGTIVKMCKLR